MLKMNRFLVAAFFVIALLFESYNCDEDVEPQIKLTKVLPTFVNPIYINILTFDFNITKENATYNNLGLHWEVIRDLPENIKLVSKIYTTDENGQNSKLFKIDITPVCVENDRRELLPKLLVVDSSKLGGKCIKKGVYELEDMGQLRFEHLIKDLPSKGKYYKVDYKLGSGLIPVQVVTFYSEWGYLNSE